MAQFNDSSDLATENGDSKIINGALVPRDQDLNTYAALGAPMMAPVWQDQSNSGVSLTKVMHSFRRRWMLALFIGVLLGIPAALATWLIFPKQFEVDATLQFRNMETFLGEDGPVNPEVNRRWRETQLHLIKSQVLLTDTLRDPKISNLSIIRNESEPIYFLQKSLSVFSPKDTDLVVIRMTGENSHEMVEIVRTLTDMYVTRASDQARADRSKRSELYRNQYDKNIEDLRQKNVAMVALMKKIGAADSDEMQTKKQQYFSEIQYMQGRLSTLEQQKSEAEQSLAKLQARKDAIDNGEYPDELIMDAIKDDTRMIELDKKIADIEELYQYQRSVAKYPQNDPAVLRTAQRLKTLNEAKDQLKVELRGTEIARLKWGKDGASDTLPAAQKRVDNLTKDVEKMAGDIEAKRTELLSLSSDSADIANMKSEIKRLEESNARLNAKLGDANLGVILTPPVEVYEPADEPEGSTLMYRVILTTFLGLCSFCIGVGGVVLLEYTKQRVSTLNEIGYGGLGIRVLGTVPNLARLSHSKNGQANGAVSGILAESIDSVRTMLLSNKRADAPKIILVTSADEHEGKTTVASHLAASLARAGRRTLLIDGDLRKPSVHTLFDMPLSAGLCEVLRGEAEIDAVVHPAQVEGMWVMLAGQCDQRAIASLAKENAEALFRTLRADYDFVVLDTGPALAFADTMLMGGHADAAVMSILRDVSQIPKVYEARERLEAIGIPVLGGVVGGVSANANRSYAMLN